MGGAASTGNQMSATDYEALAMTLSPTTRNRLPDTETALSLMDEFEALSLTDSSTGEHTTCCQCQKRVQEAAARVGAHVSIEAEMNEQPFIYRGKGYCSLDCFFDNYIKQPGLCMWIDSLFSAAVKIKQAQIHASHNEGGGSKTSQSSFNHK